MEEKSVLQDQISALTNSQAGTHLNQQALMQLKEEMTQSEQALKKKISGLESQLTERSSVVTQLQLNLNQVTGVVGERDTRIKQLELEAKKYLEQSNEAKK